MSSSWGKKCLSKSPVPPLKLASWLAGCGWLGAGGWRENPLHSPLLVSLPESEGTLSSTDRPKPIIPKSDPSIFRLKIE